MQSNMVEIDEFSAEVVPTLAFSFYAVFMREILWDFLSALSLPFCDGCLGEINYFEALKLWSLGSIVNKGRVLLDIFIILARGTMEYQVNVEIIFKLSSSNDLYVTRVKTHQTLMKVLTNIYLNIYVRHLCSETLIYVQWVVSKN